MLLRHVLADNAERDRPPNLPPCPALPAGPLLGPEFCGPDFCGLELWTARPPGHTRLGTPGPPVSLPGVLSEIRAAEARAGRAAGSVRLVAVSKGHTLEQIGAHVLAHAALQPGGFPLAENRGQELRDKVADAEDSASLEWHFIGPVQRNKVKYLKAVQLIHTIEDLEQAEAVAKAADAWGRAPDVLLQLHNGEAQKHGVSAAELPALLRSVQQTGLKVRGLMVMAPYGDPEAARRVFVDTARLGHGLGLPELSMGMSDDFPQAIATGATLVRVGRRLFTDPDPGIFRPEDGI